MHESAKRLKSSEIVKMDVSSLEMLVELCNMFAGNSDLLGLRDLALILIGYDGLLRFDVLVELRCSDVKFKENYISIQICKNTTDIYREGKGFYF